MRITMVGTGYVGLVSGACFSEFGINVICVDQDREKISALEHGMMPIYEPGLASLVRNNISTGRLSFTTDLRNAVTNTEAIFIAVGTPSRRGNEPADLSYIFTAAHNIAQVLSGDYTVIVTKSTVPVGTSRKVRDIIRLTRPDADFDVVSNPEFLREGSAIHDFMQPDRIIIGAESEYARNILRQIYRVFHLIEVPILFTNLETAELIKYATNTFLATKISFINEIADLCEKVGADVHDVARGIGFDGRIGYKFLHPGPGYGGSCFPKDTLALTRIARFHKAPLRIVETVVKANNLRKKKIVEKIISACGGSVTRKIVAVLGLTFKPNTDDMREAPSLDIVPALQKAGAFVRAFDPKGMDEAKRLMPNISYSSDVYEAIKGANALVILTEWNMFRNLDLKRILQSLKEPIMVDLRNIYDPSDMLQAGFRYTCVGRLYSQVK